MHSLKHTAFPGDLGPKSESVSGVEGLPFLPPDSLSVHIGPMHGISVSNLYLLLVTCELASVTTTVGGNNVT